MGVEVLDVPQESRYEARRDGAVLGFAAYQRTDELVVFTHTEVDPSLAGQGVGGALVKGALDHVRGLDLRVLPICPYAKAVFARRPEYGDVL